MTRVFSYSVCCVLALAASLCFGEAATTTTTNAASGKSATTLQSLREAYDKAISKIEDEYTAAMQNQPTSYLKQLTKLQQDMQKAGNLDGWTAVNHEMERFKAEQSIPDEADASVLDGIKNLRIAYKSAAAKFDLEKSKKIVVVTKQYVDQLNLLQTNLTKAGKVDEALEVNGEIKSVKSDSKVTSSEFAVAAAEQQTEKKTPPAPPAPPPAQLPDQTKKDAGADKSAKPADKVADSGGVKVYEGLPFPAVTGENFKNVSMAMTEHCPSAQKLSLTVTMYTQNDMQKTTAVSSYWGYTERRKNGSMTYSLRISLRSANKAYTLENPTVVIEYFSKPAGDNGKVDPKRFDLKKVNVSGIDGVRAINIECPAVSLQSSSYRYSDGYTANESHSSGSDFCGCVISVFDSSGTLVSQFCSQNSLKKSGADKLP